MILLQNTVIPSVAEAPVDSTAVKGLEKLTTATDSIASMTPQQMTEAIKEFDWSAVTHSLVTTATSFAVHLAAAILVFYIGRLIIKHIHKALQTILISRDVDRSLTSFLLSFVKIVLMFLLIITVIGILGVETSSFIALFASAGVAIGMALSGTLQNFAGGVLILVNKPYNIGDFIEYEGYKGFVKEIQIFHTIIRTYDNELVVIPNGGISSGTIKNITRQQYHRIEWQVSVSYGDDLQLARKAALDVIKAEPRIVTGIITEEMMRNPDDDTQEKDEEETKKKPWWKRILHRKSKLARKTAEWQQQRRADIIDRMPKIDATPYVAVDKLNESSVDIIVRAWAKSSEYWGVYYDVLENLYNELPKRGMHFPFPQLDVHMKGSGSLRS